MKRRFILILILLLVSVFSFSCKGKEDLNVASIEEASLELELGRTYTVSVNTEMMESLSFVLSDEDIASYEIENNNLLVKANKIGSAKLDVIYKEQVIDSVDLEVIEEVIYLPIPTGMILLKGVDKEASVKIILTKEGLDNEEVKWSLDTEGIVEVQTQGKIAHFHSLSRGKVEVTVSVGNYTNSFIVYVTNIRGDID
ncbi:MAG: hypothetical protein J6X93_05920 [Bacilli bacterium]|nr:hypothetical protein [Bacilli bacterium]